MVCKNCGNEIFSGDQFCKACGKPVNDQMNSMPNINQQVGGVPTKKKHKWIWITGGIIIAVIALALYFGSPDRNIEGVKEATLSGYDYGKTIGAALDNWFGGTEEWYTMEDEGTSYVCAKGECQYMTDSFEATQVFVFRLTDDGKYFDLEDAYDENGYPIFSNTGNVEDSWAMELYDNYLGVNIHDYAIKAALGDDETLSVFENANY